MKLTKTLITTLTIGTFALTASLIAAGTVSAKGPMSQVNYDVDGNGTVTEQEFNDARAQQQKAAKACGGMGQGAVNSPSFADTDTDKDGQVSTQELQTMQEKQQAGRGTGRGQGKGQGKGQGGGKSN